MSEAIDPIACVDFMRDNARALAQAKANRVYCEEFRKTLKARLMTGVGAIGAQEVAAYAHPNYEAHLEALKAAVEEETRLHWLMVAAQAKVEIWRSMESTNRAEGRAVR